MGYKLNSIRRGYIGDYIGELCRALLRGILAVQTLNPKP